MSLLASIKMLITVPQTETRFQTVLCESIALMERRKAQHQQLRDIVDYYEAEKAAYVQRMAEHKQTMAALRQQEAARNLSAYKWVI